MKFHTGIHFRTGLSLEELATIIQLQNALFDDENEFEWVIGTCEGLDKIDICRSHLVPPIETETSVIRYASEMDRVIPKPALVEIAKRLNAVGIHDIEVRGFDYWGKFISIPSNKELGI